MLFSINLSIKDGYNPILIGCDCPLISQKDFLYLKFLKKDIVIKPTYDGGFCLISLRKCMLIYSKKLNGVLHKCLKL